MSEEEDTSTIGRVKRPLPLAACGLAMAVTGAVVGSYLTSAISDNNQGIHSNARQFPPRNAAPLEFDRENPNADSGWDPLIVSKPDGPVTSADRIANYVRNGDRELRVGNYAEANSYYRDVLDDVQGVGEAAVRFRLALSAECSGASVDALAQYQYIVQKYAGSPWSSAAQLGRVRCLADGGQTELLDATIYRTLILDPDVLTPAAHEELLHVAARCLTERLLRDNHSELLDDKMMVLPDWNIDPHAELAELNRLLKSGTTVSHPPTMQVLQKIDDSPGSIYMQIHSPRAALRSVLTGVTASAGLTIEYSDAAERAIENRRQVVHANDMSLSLLLDGLTVPFGLVWQTEGRTVRIRTTTEADAGSVAQFAMDRTERILKLARTEAPTSRQVMHTRMAHGCLLFQAGRAAEAVHVFSGQVESAQGDTMGSEAAFNLGKCYLALGQNDQAEKAFYFAVDSAGQQRTTGAAGYLYLGRIQMEDARFELASSSLRRALALSRGTPMEEHAAASLGCSYLLDGRPESSNTVMFNHRDSFTSPDVRQAVEFIGALARFRSAVLPQKKELEARDVVTTLTGFRPETSFGAQWQFLAAEACAELGLAGPAMHHYIAVARSVGDSEMKGICLLRLAERYRRDQKLSDATDLLTLIRPDEAGRLNHEVALHKADLALQRKQPTQVIQQCRHIVTQSEDESVRARALRLMGRAYVQQNDRRSAIYCFAGMLPLHSQSDAPLDHGEQEQNPAQSAVDSQSESGRLR